MTTLTKRELEKFSDAAGQHIADTDRSGVPVAERHLARFQEIMARRNRQHVARQALSVFDNRTRARLSESVILQSVPELALAR